MTARCCWCVGFIRRDCTIMERCVQTGMRRPSEAERREAYRKQLASLEAEFNRRREEVRRACLGDASDARMSDGSQSA